jgi:UDP-2,3-diacylglucosamine hydrolase
MSKMFISDIHLEEHRPDIAAIFFNFMQHEAKNAEALYILGDFFESWIGDDDLTPFHLSIIKALSTASKQGLPIFLLHGNRDFLIGKKFLETTGCQLLPDEAVIDIYGIPTLLMHGDTLCTADISYLKFRNKVRKKWVQKIFLWKSLASRRHIAESYRLKSKNYVSTAPDAIMDVTQEEVERKMRQHHVQLLIHGHTHRPAIHTFLLDQQPATRTVLGAWHEKGNVLIYHPTGKNEVKLLYNHCE